MYLKSLEISGFKSFAKKTKLDFNSPIVAIVGPNGSGKSNILEAFRFVLGEQSIKSMRGKRGEDLIWNGGGEGNSRSNRASVKIIFDNRKKLFNLDFEEVSIERVVYRDSVSEYLINNSPVRLKDVLELLSGAHIGPSGHHIISQGEADRILMTSPKERKEMIEDALGLKIFQYKKKESERKLERTEENIKSAESLRREIAPHLRFLKKQVEKIERAFELKKELKDVFSVFLTRERAYIAFLKKEAKERKESVMRKKESLENDLKLAKDVAIKAVPEEKSDNLFKIQKEIGSLRAQKEILEREIGNFEGQISILERKKAKSLEQKARVENVSIVKVENFVKEAEARIKEHEEGRATTEVLISDLKSLFKSFTEELRITESEEEKEDEKEIKAIFERKREKESELQKIVEKEKAIKKDEEYLVAEIQKEKERNLSAEKEIFRLTAEQKDIYAEIRLVEEEEMKAKYKEENLNRIMEDGRLILGEEFLSVIKNMREADLENTGAHLSKEELANQGEQERKIERLKAKIEEVGGIGGEDIMKEYKETGERDAFLTKEIEDLKKSSESLRALIVDLNSRLEEDFKNGIEKINNEFDNFFKIMFGGGKAGIKVHYEVSKNIVYDENGEAVEKDEEEGEEKTAGILIDVNLPKKKIKGLEMLSGGERALTSIALLFAISQVNPPPFVILDETDAALDEANSQKYGNMIENLSKNSELILITHNRETMSRAGVLYGITMGGDGVSKVLSIAFEEAVLVAK